MGYDYVKNDKIGKEKHKDRMKLEMNFLLSGNENIKKEIYEKFAEIGIGRRAIMYAKKQEGWKKLILKNVENSYSDKWQFPNWNGTY